MFTDHSQCRSRNPPGTPTNSPGSSVRHPSSWRRQAQSLGLYVSRDFRTPPVSSGSRALLDHPSRLVTIRTALSVAELATNRWVEGGGEYYIMSRSFGKTIGGMIGFSLYISQMWL